MAIDTKTFACDYYNWRANMEENKYFAKLGHDSKEEAVENRVEPTCVVDGSYDLVVRCSRCDAVLSSETITIEATGHKAAEKVKENPVEPTCTEAGSYDSVVYCSVEGCGAELSRTSEMLV